MVTVRRRPIPQWPGDARIAVQFVVNYEEGGENCVLHGDAASEAFLSEIVGAQAWPGQRHWNMESIYEYGARAGFWRLHRLFTEAGIPVTVYGVATALKRAPAQVAAMLEAGWEIASHGLKWIEYKDHTPEAERADIEEAIRIHTAVTGTPPRGWYTGRCSVNTVDLVAAHGGLDYVSDSYADDLPYWYAHQGGYQLIIPYTLDANDMRFATPQGFNTGRRFLRLSERQFRHALCRGLCRIAQDDEHRPALPVDRQARPGRRVEAVHRLREIPRQGLVRGVASILPNTGQRVHPAPSGDTAPPSRMDATTFVQRFGGIFEHSPWIAERAFRDEQSPAMDTAAGLHAALCFQFRTASKDERLGVLKAHPDLAGKLAAAKRLTAESTSEQASAGLDALTDAEKARFTELNEAYTARFGFPFILAVKGRTKDEILENFETRIANDRDTEFRTACAQVERIARLRLNELLPE